MKFILLTFLLVIVSCGQKKLGENTPSTHPITTKQTVDGHERGNGGDEVRLEFINRGEQILISYEATIKQILSLDQFNKMKDTLNIKRILLSEKELFDYSDSNVSAIENNGVITLYIGEDIKNLNWQSLFKNSKRVNKLILHEILRSSGLNDDDYVYSNKIMQPISYLSFNQKKNLIIFEDDTFPITAKQTIKHGVRSSKRKIRRHCGKAYEYNISVTGKLNCSKKGDNSICSVKEALTGSHLVSFNTYLSDSYIDYLKDYGNSVIINCTYSADQMKSCKDGSKNLIDDYRCSLQLSEHINQYGKRLKKKKIRQQREQQQETFWDRVF
jgi:hypothetical protein